MAVGQAQIGVTIRLMVSAVNQKVGGIGWEVEYVRARAVRASISCLRLDPGHIGLQLR